MQYIASIKEKKDDDFGVKERDMVIELCQYYSNHCKHTADEEKVNRLLDLFNRGMLNLVSLRNELGEVKERYAEAEFLEFCKVYEEMDTREPTGNPYMNQERYMINKDLKMITRLADNLVQYKQKLKAEGKPVPPTKLVYLNMTSVDEYGRFDESYKLTKFY